MQPSSPKEHRTEKWMKCGILAYHKRNSYSRLQEQKSLDCFPFPDSGCSTCSSMIVSPRRLLAVWRMQEEIYHHQSLETAVALLENKFLCWNNWQQLEEISSQVGMKNQNLKKVHRPEIWKQFSHCLNLCCSENGRLHTCFKTFLNIYIPHETYSSQSICHLSRINLTKLYGAANGVTKSRGD